MPCLPFRARLFAPAFSRLIVSLALLLAGAVACVADAPAWDIKVQGGFITSLCRDNHGCLWIGTEDNGVWRLDPSAPKDTQYSHFTHENGLGDDDAYALACDKRGRIWVGTLNHGVSVFNGKEWKTYGPLDGPLGSRVFALAVSPQDGGVWMATEAGLARYRNDRWSYYTRADGLPSDQANALAFSQSGILYVGTQCDGIAIGSPANDYHTWRVVTGPRQMPNAPTGPGLPTSLINCLLVVRDGTVYAGTPMGLASSGDGGRTWRYRRGADWKAKLAGLADPVPPSARPVEGHLLREDYVTCLAEDGYQGLWVGHRQAGLELLERGTGQRLLPNVTEDNKDDFVTCLLPDGPGVWAGRYGSGLMLRYADTLPLPAPSHETAAPPLPAPAAPPALAELTAMLRIVSRIPPDPHELQPKAVALDDDWTTEGDWLGRYGRYWACLCATSSPSDYLWGSGWELVRYALQSGPNRTDDDSLRYWIQWLYTQNPHVLELPSVYLDSRVQRKLTTWEVNRRESEVDDHGETYPMTKDGPHIYCTLTVPPGLYYLSLYDFNKDGHDGSNRFRDYHVSIRPHPPEKNIGDISGFANQPEWTDGRIRDFWGGVWKRFLVRGPVSLTVEINRNHSFNTILPAVMLDLVDENPPPYSGTPEQRLAWRNEKRQLLLSQWRPANTTHSVSAANAPEQAADEVFDALQRLELTNGAWWAVNGRRFYAPLLRSFTAQARAGLSAESTQRRLSRSGTCYYQMGMYTLWEQCQRQTGLTPARDIEKALRWNGDNGMGHGFEAVTAYVTSHAANTSRIKTVVSASSLQANGEKGGKNQQLSPP